MLLVNLCNGSLEVGLKIIFWKNVEICFLGNYVWDEAPVKNATNWIKVIISLRGSANYAA